MSKLHQLLAVTADLEAKSKRMLSEAHDTFKNKATLFQAVLKRTEMFSEDHPLVADEHQIMETTVGAKLDWLQSQLSPWLDTLLTKERTNRVAAADLVVGGVTIATALPAPFLLTLENKLKIMRDTYKVIPTLKSGVKWEADEGEGHGVYKAAYPEERFKTNKVVQHRVLYEATDHHPAQIETWNEDVKVGKAVTTEWSGNISTSDKAEMLSRFDLLYEAVKKARQAANNVNLDTGAIGDKVFAYIHKGTL